MGSIWRWQERREQSHRVGRGDLDQRVRGGACDPQRRAVVVVAAATVAAGGDARRQATAHQVGRGGRWPPGRRILGLGLVVVVLGGLWGIAAGVLVHAATDPAQPADALVVLAGGRGERLPKALVLVQQDVAPVLVISNGRDARWQAANQLCASRQRFEVVCPQPAPDTTRGEARMVRDLAARRGWRSVVVVTSTYHARRAQLLVGRCFDGQLQIVAAPTRAVASHVGSCQAQTGAEGGAATP